MRCIAAEIGKVYTIPDNYEFIFSPSLKKSVRLNLRPASFKKHSVLCYKKGSPANPLRWAHFRNKGFRSSDHRVILVLGVPERDENGWVPRGHDERVEVLLGGLTMMMDNRAWRHIFEIKEEG